MRDHENKILRREKSLDVKEDIPLIDDGEDNLQEEEEEEEEEEEKEKEKEEEEMIVVKPSRGSVSIWLPLSCPPRSQSVHSELSPDVFQLRAPLVSLESLVLSPGNVNVEQSRELRDMELQN